jgi:hypothetical protein
MEPGVPGVNVVLHVVAEHRIARALSHPLVVVVRIVLDLHNSPAILSLAMIMMTTTRIMMTTIRIMMTTTTILQ